MHEPSTSVCTSRTLALCTSRTLAFCRSWPCLRNKLCNQKFLQDITPFPPANPTTHESHPNCRSGIHARLVLKPRISHVGRAFMPDSIPDTRLTLKVYYNPSSPPKLPFTRNTIAITIHFGIRAITQKEHRFIIRTHLRAMLPTVTAERWRWRRRVRARFK